SFAKSCALSKCRNDGLENFLNERTLSSRSARNARLRPALRTHSVRVRPPLLSAAADRAGLAGPGMERSPLSLRDGAVGCGDAWRLALGPAPPAAAGATRSESPVGHTATARRGIHRNTRAAKFRRDSRDRTTRRRRP